MTRVKYGQNERSFRVRIPGRIIEIRLTKVTRINPETQQLETKFKATHGQQVIIRDTFPELRTSVLSRIAQLWDREF